MTLNQNCHVEAPVRCEALQQHFFPRGLGNPQNLVTLLAAPARQTGAGWDLDSLTVLDKVAAKRGTAAHPFLA